MQGKGRSGYSRQVSVDATGMLVVRVRRHLSCILVMIDMYLHKNNKFVNKVSLTVANEWHQQYTTISQWLAGTV